MLCVYIYMYTYVCVCVCVCVCIHIYVCIYIYIYIYIYMYISALGQEHQDFHSNLEANLGSDLELQPVGSYMNFAMRDCRHLNSIYIRI
jgi:hypothetical protein